MIFNDSRSVLGGKSRTEKSSKSVASPGLLRMAAEKPTARPLAFKPQGVLGKKQAPQAKAGMSLR